MSLQRKDRDSSTVMEQDHDSDFRSHIDDREGAESSTWNLALEKDTELMPLMRLQCRGMPDDQPKQSSMANALKIRQQEELPALKLKPFWYGCPLGLWDDEDDRLAELVARGEYFQSKQTKGY